MKLKIEKVVNGGYGLSRSEDGKVILVEGAYPGEEVIARITRDKKEFAFAKVEAVLKPSDHRVKPICKHFGRCGGCQFMDVDYEYQLFLKKMIVHDQFRGRFDVEDTIPSVPNLNYRTKIELTASVSGTKVILGFKKRYSHDVVPIDSCSIAPERANTIIPKLPKILEALEIPVYDFKRKRGVLKHVVIRHAFSTDQTMLIFVTKTESFPGADRLKKLVLKNFPWLHSLIHVMNSKDSIVLRGPYRTLHGEGIIVEEMGWETYQIPPTAFFQSNTNVAERLADEGLKSLDLSGSETVIDLYSGIGFFSIKLAKSSRRVIGVESNRVAVKAARSNANVNDVRNVEFVEADVEDFLESFDSKVDAVVLDPPRSGAGKRVVDLLGSLKPKKIVYVSCEVSTLVRDVMRFLERGYEIVRIVPFDMFPHTFHVETMVFLKRSERP